MEEEGVEEEDVVGRCGGVVVVDDDGWWWWVACGWGLSLSTHKVKLKSIRMMQHVIRLEERIGCGCGMKRRDVDDVDDVEMMGN